MKAMLVDDKKNLVWSDVEKPVPKDDEILIKIYAAALNRADLLQRKGAYPSPKGWPQWMGLEVSGVIEDMGEKAQKESGKIKPSVYKVLPIEKADEAHEILENGENIGKVVLRVCEK